MTKPFQLLFASLLWSLIIGAGLCGAVRQGWSQEQQVQDKSGFLLAVVSENCEPCQKMKPALEKLNANGFGVMVLDYEKYQKHCEKLGVKAVPTFLMIRGGKEQARVVGACSYERLVELWSK